MTYLIISNLACLLAFSSVFLNAQVFTCVNAAVRFAPHDLDGYFIGCQLAPIYFTCFCLLYPCFRELQVTVINQGAQPGTATLLVSCGANPPGWLTYQPPASTLNNPYQWTLRGPLVGNEIKESYQHCQC